MINLSTLTLTPEHLSNYIDLFYSDQKLKDESEQSFLLHSIREKEQTIQNNENVYGDFFEAIESVKNTTFKILLGYWDYGYANAFVKAVVENDLKNAIYYGDKEDQLFLDFYLYAMENIQEKFFE
jgi:hypothetical protein